MASIIKRKTKYSVVYYYIDANGEKRQRWDTGHAQIDMITDVYSHILDEDRKVNAQKFEAAFYSNPDLRDVRPPSDINPSFDLQALLTELQNNPELATTLAQILSTIKS